MNNDDNLQIFNFEGNGVRTIMLDGEIWFVLKDVCNVLGLSNTTKVAQRLEKDELTNFNLGSRNGMANIVNEKGLYRVIFGSNKEEAKKFQNWVFGEVLPPIRKKEDNDNDIVYSVN